MSGGFNDASSDCTRCTFFLQLAEACFEPAADFGSGGDQPEGFAQQHGRVLHEREAVTLKIALLDCAVSPPSQPDYQREDERPGYRLDDSSPRHRNKHTGLCGFDRVK
jgi:hypothetical protein